MFSVNLGTPQASQIQNLIDKKMLTVKQAMNEIADDTAKFTSNYILSHSRRGNASGKLAKEFAKTIKSGSVSKGDFSVGIGDTTKLTLKVPYWYVVNYGKKITGEAYVPNYGRPVGGHFIGSNVPEKGGDGERFKQGGPFAMKAGKAIHPMRYIEAAKRYFKDRWKARFKQ